MNYNWLDSKIMDKLVKKVKFKINVNSLSTATQNSKYVNMPFESQLTR